MGDLHNCNEALLGCLKRFIPDYDKLDQQVLNNLVEDIENSKIKYGFLKYDEYFLYHFYKMPEDKRNTFIGMEYYNRIIIDAVRPLKGSYPTLKDKFKTYEFLKPYFKRQIIEINDFSDYNKFIDFIQNNKSFIVKEKERSLGANVSKININEATSVRNTFLRLLQYGGCICEEWLNQSQEFAQFNSTSVNTIRFVTLYDGNKFYKVFALLRTGRNGSIVDNAAQGGLFAEIDVNSGKVISNGCSEKDLKIYECHPDSGKKYKGFQVPCWEELVCIAEELHKKCYPLKIVGWDFTLTEKGWVLIEGNNKPDVIMMQVAHYSEFGNGLKNEINFVLSKI